MISVIATATAGPLPWRNSTLRAGDAAEAVAPTSQPADAAG